ncbi:hypothetical protein Syun_007088 [Stephania yunnanensis]|uniref:Uncharacterized protein n=1 Tax=Stephania yunnanensis TaxID=152371 RepID=A0AAP0PY75_9MAGN
MMQIREEIDEIQREWFIPFLETSSEVSREEIIELTLVDDDLSIEEEWYKEIEQNCMLNLHDCTIIEEAEKEVEHIQERSYKPYEDKKEDQPLVMMNPSRILMKFEMGIEKEGRLEILYGVDNYVLDSQDYMDTYVLEDHNELKIQNEGMPISLPRVMMNLFVLDYSQVVGVM